MEDKELDEIINQGNCDYPKEVKAALLAWRDRQIGAELKDILDNVVYEVNGKVISEPNIRNRILGRYLACLSQLGAKDE